MRLKKIQTGNIRTWKKTKNVFDEIFMDTKYTIEEEESQQYITMNQNCQITVLETRQQIQTAIENLQMVQKSNYQTLNMEIESDKIPLQWKRRVRKGEKVNVSPLTSKRNNSNSPENGVGIQGGPIDSNPRLDTITSHNKQRSKNKLNNEITLAQWNIRGLGTMKKTDIINSINCDILALQETGHPSSNILQDIHMALITAKQRKDDTKGGGTITLSDLHITSKSEFHINRDSTLTRLVLDGVFILWFGNIQVSSKVFEQKIFPAV